MHLPPSRLTATFLITTCFALAAVSASAADKVKFPADDPAFSVEFPAGWTCKAGEDGNLDCEVKKAPNYVFSIVDLKNIKSQKDLKTALPALAQTMADGMKLKEFETGDIDTDEVNDVTFTGIRGDGKSEGIQFVVLVHAFEPKKGRFFAIITAATAEDDKKREKEYDDITASIEPIE